LYYLGLKYQREELIPYVSPVLFRGEPWGSTNIHIPHDVVKAIEYFDEYLKTDPKGFWAPVIRTEFGAMARESADGLRRVREAIKKNPQDLDALTYLSGIYENMGLYRKSKLAAERFIEVAPNDNKNRRGEVMRDRIQRSDFDLTVQREYFDKNPDKLKEVEAELGFKLFEGEVTLP